LILYIYLIREILKYCVIVLVSVTAIFLVVDFFERIDNFMEAGLPVMRALIYLVFKIPYIINLVLPLSLLLAVLITFGLMSKNNELIALKSSGIGIFTLSKPVLALGAAFTIFLFVFAEIIVPLTSSKSNRIWLQEVKKSSAVVSREKNIWLKDNHLIANIQYYEKSKKTLWGITLFYFDEHFRLARRLDARKAVFSGKDWKFFKIMEQRLNEKTGEYDVSFPEQRTESLNLSPENLETVVKKSEEMGFAELYHYVQKIEAEGYDAVQYRVDLHAKVAFSFICFLLSAAGLGIAAGARAKDALITNAAYGLCLAFFYWVFYSFCRSLGQGGMLPPFVAAWTANFLIACFGAVLLLKAR
jgi:lipopolysaccharide export system permease protein